MLPLWKNPEIYNTNNNNKNNNSRQSKQPLGQLCKTKIAMDGNEADFFKKQNLSYLAGFKYLKHQRQPLCDELLCVLFFLDGLEFL